MKVSVMVITYNHERFIAQALEGVLAQKVNFDYEVVVGEDCSTDRTREILMDFHRRYPDKIVPLLRDHNIGGKENLLATLAACRGQYVALLEGDDYWISEDKLQKQVDFLDAHPDFAMCCSRVEIVHEDGTHASEIWPSRVAGAYGLEDLLAENFVATCSVLYRWDSVEPLPAWFRKVRPGDWALHALVTRTAKIELMDDVMAVYRVHAGSLWSTQTERTRFRKAVRMLKALDKHLEFQYTSTIRRTIARHRRYVAEARLGMAHAAREKGNRGETAKQVAGYLWNGGLKYPDTWRAFASFTGYALFGSWYEAIRKAKQASRG
ncbi:MAG TPA: glycosyltransferase [Candidatus Acidoferrales bacterium]|nr:glycosyltransferase [Candidatus Acidoferrales bacterium]